MAPSPPVPDGTAAKRNLTGTPREKRGAYTKQAQIVEKDLCQSNSVKLIVSDFLEGASIAKFWHPLTSYFSGSSLTLLALAIDGLTAGKLSPKREGSANAAPPMLRCSNTFKQSSGK